MLRKGLDRGLLCQFVIVHCSLSLYKYFLVTDILAQMGLMADYASVESDRFRSLIVSRYDVEF